MSRNPLSLAALTVLELSPADMVSCAAEAGYSHVGLRLIPATDREPTWPIIGDTPLVREVERRLADTGIKVLDIEIFRLKPDTRVDDYRAALETGAKLGARHVLVAGNDPDESRLVERFAALCDLGAPLGLTMNLEPMPWTDVKTLQQGARVIARRRDGRTPAYLSTRFISTAPATPQRTSLRFHRKGFTTRSYATRPRNVRRIPRRSCIRHVRNGSCRVTADSI